MMSPVSYTSGLYSTNTCSKPALRMLPRLSTISSTITMPMPGMVMCHAFCQRPAPSIDATSYRVGSIEVMAAR